MRSGLRIFSLLFVSLISSDLYAQIDFRQESIVLSTATFANRIVKTDDHESKSFIIVDKINAKVFVFDRFGHFVAAAPALLGLTRGDQLSPGLGARRLSSIRPSERTTPAGRFLSSFDYNVNGDLVLWIDYDSGVAMHAVITTSPGERRIQRLESPSVTDNRITYGCINVAAEFYENIIIPQFSGVFGFVYILPEMKSLPQVFGAEAQAGQPH